ncbi:MAG: transposase, partial [Deltaproteobacteria bacterium]|nr:transposase [Deltaproteobacteria bacterium]
KYRTPADVCKTCQFNTSCKSKTRGIGRRYRDINVSDFHVYQALIRAREKTDDFKSRMRERMWKIEGLFAEGKGNHGLKRAKYRGRSKAQIQSYVIAAVQNLKRLIGAVGGNYLDFITRLIEMIAKRFFSEKIGNLAA